MIKKEVFTPMLASAPGPEGVKVFPVFATPKIDGIRAIMVQGTLSSRTLKPIPNATVRAALEAVLPDGCDGELMFGNTFQDCTSAVMTRDGPRSGFTYFAFDVVPDTRLQRLSPYSERIEHLALLMEQPSRVKLLKSVAHVVNVVVLLPILIEDALALTDYEGDLLARGFEGVIVRDPLGRYKFGRSTAKEGLMLKVKRFEDAEAVITGTDELIHGNNIDGPSGKRGASSALLGALVVTRPDGVQFKIGSGFTAAQRKALWKTRAALVGNIVKYKFFPIGTKDAPRFPTFLGFRDPQDM